MYQGIIYSKIYTLNKILLLNLTVTDYFKNSLSKSLNVFFWDFGVYVSKACYNERRRVSPILLLLELGVVYCTIFLDINVISKFIHISSAD